MQTPDSFDLKGRKCVGVLPNNIVVYPLSRQRTYVTYLKGPSKTHFGRVQNKSRATLAIARATKNLSPTTSGFFVN